MELARIPDAEGALAALTIQAARAYKIDDRVGSIEAGKDADIVIFDPEQKHTLSANTHHSNVDYSLFEGREVTGKVRKVFSRGRLIVDGDQWLGRAGMGQFLRRSASGRIL